MLQLADKCCVQVALCGGLFYCLVGVCVLKRPFCVEYTLRKVKIFVCNGGRC